MLCPCGTKKQFKACCKPYLSGQQFPSTPELLMRSRYTAYTLADTGYIQKTMKGKAAYNFDAENVRTWTTQVQWIDLKVVNAQKPKGSVGQVEFIARFIEQEKLYVIHELSEFLFEDGQWFYTDGVQHVPSIAPEKIGRNTACPCKSGKKFKQCHGKA